MKHSFFCIIQSKLTSQSQTEIDSKELLISHFGLNRILNCMNRVDAKFKKCPISVSNLLNENLTLDTAESWLMFENIVGWVTDQISE
jgi:hypothetical protein